jgi:hypothetical protein
VIIMSDKPLGLTATLGEKLEQGIFGYGLTTYRPHLGNPETGVITDRRDTGMSYYSTSAFQYRWEAILLTSVSRELRHERDTPILLSEVHANAIGYIVKDWEDRQPVHYLLEQLPT